MSKHLVIIFATLAVIVPIFFRIRNVPWNPSLLTDGNALLAYLFPFFGLLAFTLLWLHAMSGVFEEWLREKFEFDKFVHWTAIIILVSMILHVLMLLVITRFNISSLFEHNPAAIFLGIVGFVLLLTYDVGKIFRSREFFVRHWDKTLVVSTIGFIFIFFHSLMIGSDLQQGFMRWLWIFYGVTAILATIYTYGIKRFTKRSSH
ncbi:MAG: hypothetical protein NUV78_02000 [Candidatus Zambryskibacteria bacterium]|nr:hypothetical protein [Candidatus Zambryskibacteria bacterium]